MDYLRSTSVKDEVLVFIGTSICMLAIILCTALFIPTKTEAFAVDETNYDVVSDVIDKSILEVVYSDYDEYEIDTISDYLAKLDSLKDDSENMEQNLLDKYSTIMRDSDKDNINKLYSEMMSASLIGDYYSALNNLTTLEAELEGRYKELKAENAYLNRSGGCLTKDGGVFYFNGRKETWYSIHEPGQTATAHPIPGKHIGEDGIIRDADGYICVAASDLKPYTVIETSLGMAKVYDCGCLPGITDVYVSWV